MRLPGFKGGLASSKFEPLSNQTFQTAEDLDVFSSPNILTPHIKLGLDSTDQTMNTVKIQAAYLASNNIAYLLGNSGTNNQQRLFSTASGFNSATTLTTVATSATSTTAPSSTNLRNIVEYKDYLYFCGSATVLSRYGTLSSGPSYTESWQSGRTALTDAMLSHEGLGLLFFGDKNTVAKFDNSTFTAPALTLGLNWRVVSLAEYGRFVLVGARDVNNGRNSKVFVWDGSATTVDDVIDIGDLGLQSVRNVNGVVHIITLSNSEGGILNNRLRIYTWSGGQVNLAKELDLKPTSVVAGGVVRDSAVEVVQDTIYFGLSFPTTNTMTASNGVYAFGHGKVTEPRILTLDRLNHTPDKLDIAITSVKKLGSNFVVTWNDGTNFYLNHQTTASGTVSDDGVYETIAFPLRNGKPGKIKRITIPHFPLVASTGFTVQVKHYGHYPKRTSIPSEDSYADLTTSEGSGSSTGKTQSTTNTTYTIIDQPNVFKTAQFASIKILFDEISTVNAVKIIADQIEVELE